MGRILPSQVVEFVEKAFPDVVAKTELSYGIKHLTRLAALVRLVDSVPPELIVLQSQQLVELSVALEVIRSGIDTLRTQPRGAFVVGAIVDGVNPVRAIYRTLKSCRDDAPSSEVHALDFVDDPAFRDSLRIDLDGVNRAVANAEWKAATVLAGSVAEALLLWSIERRADAEIDDTVRKLAGSGDWSRKTREWWGLHEYSLVAFELHHISRDTKKAVAIAKNFRNLIHPGAAVRLGIACDRGTAFMAVGAADHVARDLERWAAAYRSK